MTEAAARSRRLLPILLGALVVGAAALLWSSSMVWSVEVVARESPLPSVAYSINGADAVPMVLALGLVALAAVVALLATGPVGRRLVGMVLFVVAVWTAVSLYEWVSAPQDDRSQQLSEDGTRQSVDDAPETSSVAGPMAMLGVALTAGTGLAVLLTARQLPRMSSKYDRPRTADDKPTKRPAADEDGSGRDRSMWSSLDRGEDPTD